MFCLLLMESNNFVNSTAVRVDYVESVRSRHEIRFR